MLRRSSASVYYCRRKLKNRKNGVTRTRLTSSAAAVVIETANGNQGSTLCGFSPLGVIVSLVLLPSDSIGSVGLIGHFREVGKPLPVALYVCVIIIIIANWSTVPEL